MLVAQSSMRCSFFIREKVNTNMVQRLPVMWEGMQALSHCRNNKELYLLDGIDECYGAITKEFAVPVCTSGRDKQISVLFSINRKKFTFFMQITLKNKVTVV